MENDVKKFDDFLNENNSKYPYEDKNILVLVVKYSKSGVEQLANIQFNNGEIFNRNISVDWYGNLEIPSDVHTMEEVVDFLYKFSYSPKKFFKIDSVKYPLYKSEHTTELLVDDITTERIRKYFEEKDYKSK